MGSAMTVKSPKPADIRIGKQIRSLRRIAGVSQSALAEKIGVSLQQVKKYENGTNRVSSGRLQEIAGELGVPVSTLYGELQTNGTASLPDSDETFELVEIYTRLSPQRRRAARNMLRAFARLR